MYSGILVRTLSHVLSALDNENDFLHRIVCTWESEWKGNACVL